MSLPSIRSLEAFVATAQFGSLASASERVAMSVPALSRRLSELERHLGAQLFDRTPRGMLLTSAGARYLPHAQTAIERLRVGAADLHRQQSLVRVTTIPAFATRWLLPRLPDFVARHPGIEVDVRTSLTFERLDDGLHDIAVRLALDTEMAGLAPLLPIHLSPVWDSSRSAVTRPSDLLGRKLLGPEHRPEFWREWFDATGLEPAIAVREVDPLLLYDRTMHDDVVSIGIEPLVSGLLAEGRLRNLPGFRVRSKRSLFLLGLDGVHKPVARIFGSWLRHATNEG